MLDNLLIGCTGHFYATLKPLDQGAVEALFNDLRDSVENAGPNLVHRVRDSTAGVTYSAICFTYDRTPAFFEESFGQRDRVHGFMLVVEALDYLAVIKSRFEIPNDFKSEWLTRIESGRVEAAVATADAIFQKMRIKPMTISKTTLRAKTVEANNLANAMPMASASRSVPQGYTVRRGSDTYSATPSTGQISMRADKSNYSTAIAWARIVIDALDTTTSNLAPFIENFARQANLSSIKSTTSAIQLAIDVAELSDRLFDSKAKIKLVKKLKPDTFEDLTVGQTEKLLTFLDQEFVLSGLNTELKVNDKIGAEIGTLRWGKTRIGLSTFAPEQCNHIYVKPTTQAGTAASQVTPLKSYIDREDLFIVLFEDVSFAYLKGELFQDKAMANGGHMFLGHMICDPCLTDANSEKGKFSSGQTQFSADSVFRKVVDTIAADHDVLICDDLGDEWADFIGMDTMGKPPRISFYHAKHGEVSLGASPFHISVSQAEKNLGQLLLPEPLLKNKFAAWKKTYRGEKVTTSIPRLLRGGSKPQILGHARKLRASPETVTRVLIVTSSLSFKSLKKTFAGIKKGDKPSAHFVQLYWLLTSFFSACAEVGSIGYVVCRP